ncbi:MAG: hypothetical protein GX977_06050 [Firmicutes bacterium]|nr:hypothetical protein [Bacillota bacterium]
MLYGLTRKERILRTIQRKPVDRLPVNLELTVPCAQKVIDDLGIRHDELLGVLDSHIVYAYLNDTVKRENGIIYDNWGVGYDEHEGAAIRVHPMEDELMADRYEFPDPKSPTLLSSVEKTVSDYGQEFLIPVYQKWLLFERACWLRGVENFLIDMVANRPFAEWLLDQITDYQIKLAKRAVETGIDCGRTGDDWGGQTGLLFSPTLWRELIKPRLKRIWDVYKNAGLPIIHHSCGLISEIIPDLVELGLDVLHPLQTVISRKEVKGRYGSSLVFYGGIDTQHVIPFGSTEDISAEVDDCFETLGRDGGYIVGFAHTLTSETPLENLYAVLDAVRRRQDM